MCICRMYVLKFVTCFKCLRKCKCIVPSSDSIVRVSYCITFNRESYHSEYLLVCGAYKGKVIELRNSKQRLEATRFCEPQDFCFSMAVDKSQQVIQCFWRKLLAVFRISKLKCAMAAARRVLAPEIFPRRNLTWCIVVMRDRQYCVSILPCCLPQRGISVGGLGIDGLRLDVWGFCVCVFILTCHVFISGRWRARCETLPSDIWSFFANKDDCFLPLNWRRQHLVE